MTVFLIVSRYGMRGSCISEFAPNLVASLFFTTSRCKSPCADTSVSPVSVFFSTLMDGSSSKSLARPENTLSSSPCLVAKIALEIHGAGNLIFGYTTALFWSHSVSPVLVTCSFAIAPRSPRIELIHWDELFTAQDIDARDLFGFPGQGVIHRSAGGERSAHHLEQRKLANERVGDGFIDKRRKRFAAIALAGNSGVRFGIFPLVNTACRRG